MNRLFITKVSQQHELLRVESIKRAYEYVKLLFSYYTQLYVLSLVGTELVCMI